MAKILENQIVKIPKKALKKGVVVLSLERWEKIEKENSELRLAIEAILAGELALQKNQTRSFREFLKSEFPEYAKNL